VLIQKCNDRVKRCIQLENFLLAAGVLLLAISQYLKKNRAFARPTYILCVYSAALDAVLH
jgi:hypothetical protein